MGIKRERGVFVKVYKTKTTLRREVSVGGLDLEHDFFCCVRADTQTTFGAHDTISFQREKSERKKRREEKSTHLRIVFPRSL